MKTEQEINAEKASKPAVQHVPSELVLAAGRAIGYGVSKHGIATADGWGTWRVAGTQQADPLTHYGCLLRHLAEWRSGTTNDPESGLSHLDHAAAQLAILLDLLARPPVAAATPVTVSTFAAGAIEGEDPWKLPAGWAWVLPSATRPRAAAQIANGFENTFARGQLVIDDFDEDHDLHHWSGLAEIPVAELKQVREIVRRRNGWAPG